MSPPISWPRVFISALPGVGIAFGIINVRKNQELYKLFSDLQKARYDTRAAEEIFQKICCRSLELLTALEAFQPRMHNIADLIITGHITDEATIQEYKQLNEDIKKALAEIKDRNALLKEKQEQINETKKKNDTVAAEINSRIIDSNESINVYARAAIVSHLLTLVALVVLVATGILSSPYLAIGTLNLAGLYFYSKKVGELENQIRNQRNLVSVPA